MKEYYIPTIEEFCIKFQYELYQNKIIGWEKKEISLQTDLEAVNYHLNNGDIRVKYLDKEDIESYNFNYEGEGVDIVFSKKGMFKTPDGRHNISEYKLRYNLTEHELNIECFFGGISEGKLFEGIIKNINEFKKLLKQLKIDGIY